MATILVRDGDFTWGQLETADLVWLSFILIVGFWPFISAFQNKTSFALATVLSILLVHFMQFALRIFNGGFFDFYPTDFLSLIPSISSDPLHLHRMFTSAWLHGDFLHVLGNSLIIGLVGVPLEQRLGARRWLSVYFLGFLGGNIAWILSHPDSNVPAIGASGAAFGILGAYMACWPEDRIAFPLFFLIFRDIQVWVIAFLFLGYEILRMYSIQSGTIEGSNIAHMAHVGGFFLAYLLARPIARGAPSPLGEPGAPTMSSSLAEDLRKQTTARMGDLSDDPWTNGGKPLTGAAARILTRLRKEGDELETRRAWLEELSENTICPICEGELVTLDDRGVCRLTCSISRDHIRWP